ncbi:exopolysaccharide biosynthesis polyprenyl glycosylphosphotransferase [Streptomyces pseudogriseolus]|uniref:exopolysaccharide biosynthesis polyprenyl glycosylphosphotransferase n=1 Tax=Streptomyces pseudogriseolus TaxID=36817 RepID=UPI003FA2C6E2
MTAESAAPLPDTRHRGHRFTSFPVLSPPGPPTGVRLPVRRPAARWLSLLPMLAADGAAAVLGALTLSDTALRPLSVAVLVTTSMVLCRDRVSLPRAAGALDELPFLCCRIPVAWLILAEVVTTCAAPRSLSVHVLLTGCALHLASGCALRGLVHMGRRTALLRRPRTALVFGPAVSAQRVAAALLRHPGCGVRPVGVVTDRPEGIGDLPVLTTDEEARRAVVQNGVRAALIVHPSERTAREPLLRALADSGCALWEVAAEAPSYRAETLLAGYSCRRLDVAGPRRGRAAKRLLDVLVSGALLLLLSPLLLACAVTLRITGGPGVVFRQERIGKDGKPFTLLKFRTHRPADEKESATRWSVAHDNEMRRFCRVLRRTSLDELLQLWNVLRGDMSLVGPRPERPYFVTQFSQAYPGYAARHRMRTGITGLAQIHGLRGDTSIEDRCRFDNAYIDNWSLWRDISILLRTACVLVRPTGS